MNMQCLRLIVIVLCVTVAACGRLPGRPPPPATLPTPGANARQALISKAHGLIGVPYRRGGENPSQGMDCSGLIFYLHKQLGIHVPRTTRGLFYRSAPVSRHELKPGDLVFFRLGHGVSHVGLYVGRGQFIHAPSSGKYVRQSPLDKPFWKHHWVRGGRLL